MTHDTTSATEPATAAVDATTEAPSGDFTHPPTRRSSSADVLSWLAGLAADLGDPYEIAVNRGFRTVELLITDRLVYERWVTALGAIPLPRRRQPYGWIDSAAAGTLPGLVAVTDNPLWYVTVRIVTYQDAPQRVLDNMVTLVHNGQTHRMPSQHMTAWLAGLNGTLDASNISVGEYTDAEVNVQQVTIDADPSTSRRMGSGNIYHIEFDGTLRDLHEAWVMPWLLGLAARNNLDASDLGDPEAAERARQIQALMVAHKLGWLRYLGFTREDPIKKETE